MHFYPHHIGDYAQATGHLTFVEDAAYCRLLRKCYAEERPLPADLRAVQRLVGARTDEEREAVDVVLREFFTLGPDGWSNKRAESEIAAYAEKSEKAKSSAAARWGKSKTQTARTADALPTQCERIEESCERIEESCERNANQNHNQNQSKPPTPQAAAIPDREVAAPTIPPLPCGDFAVGSIAADPITGRACELAGLLRQRGAALQASNPTVRQWAADGVTDAEALTALELAESRRADSRKPQQAINAGLLNAILPDIRTKAPGGGARASPRDKRRAEGQQWAREAITTAAQRQEADDGRTIDVR